MVVLVDCSVSKSPKSITSINNYYLLNLPDLTYPDLGWPCHGSENTIANTILLSPVRGKYEISEKSRIIGFSIYPKGPSSPYLWFWVHKQALKAHNKEYLDP